MPLPLHHELRAAIDEAQADWRVGLSLITGMTDQARQVLLGVTIDRDEVNAMIAAANAPGAGAGAPAAGAGTAPAAFDWRNVNGKDHVTAVKFQGTCGACVSFASCGVLESMVLIKKNVTTDLSEADMHFCSVHGASCAPWWPTTAMAELQRRGVPDDASFPYSTAFVDDVPVCRLATDRDQRAYKITGSTMLTTMADRKAWIANNGPVCGVFQVYDDFYNYQSGVYRHVSGGTAGYHCVEIVGYSDTEQCWIAKNSWGASWGESGFFRMGYGECGIDETSNDTDKGQLNRFAMWGINDVVMPAMPVHWSGWQGLGGELASAPSAASRSADTLDVFARGTDNALWQRSFANGAWSGWHSLGGAIMSAPAAVSWGPGRLDVFARGFDNALWHRAFDNDAWADWENMGGALSSDPAVSSWGANRLDVFGRGPDNQLWHLWFDGTQWNGWERLGGGLSATPAAVSSAFGKIDAFARGIDNALWHRPFDQTTGWGEWHSLGQQLNSAPTAASWGPDHLDVFMCGFDSSLWHIAFEGGWQAWENLGGTISSAPSAVSRNTALIDVFARGTDNKLLQKSFT